MHFYQEDDDPISHVYIMSAPTLTATHASADIELRPLPTYLDSLTLSVDTPSSPKSRRESSSRAAPSNPPDGPDDYPFALDRLADPLNSQSLHPVDRGSNAWLFLLGATSIEILIFGLPYSIGVLHLYWTNTLFPGHGASTITLAATLQAGLLYMMVAVFGP
jgi:hypothetical protein